MRRTPADESGMALIAAILVCMALIGLVMLSLTTANRADNASVRDRNSDIALAVSEAGVQDAIARIQASNGTWSGTFTNPASTVPGHYKVMVTKTAGAYTIDSTGRSSMSAGTKRQRRVKVTLKPPGAINYALFSYTSIELKNNDGITGGVWANDSVLVEEGTQVHGDVTAARSWIDMEGGTLIDGFAWAGGYNAGAWAIRMANGAVINGGAKASIVEPTDPTVCNGELPSNYRVIAEEINGGLTTWGVADGGTVSGTYTPNTCTAAPPRKPMPPFTFNHVNYDSATYQEFSSVSAFHTWLDAHKSSLEGTFYVQDPAPTQAGRIDLSGAVMTGNVTLVTNAPVYTNDITDVDSGSRLLTIVSHYQPPAGSACEVNHDGSECAVHLKNHFEPSCLTAALIYADRGPVAVKNNAEQCGAIYSDAILVKNNQTLRYDERVQDAIGFGTVTYDVARWEELPAS